MAQFAAVTHDRLGRAAGSFSRWRTMSSRTCFARATERALTAVGKDVALVELRGAGRCLYGPRADSIRRVERFVSGHLAQ